MNGKFSFPTDQRKVQFNFVFIVCVINSCFLIGEKQFWSCRNSLSAFICPEITGERSTCWNAEIFRKTIFNTAKKREYLMWLAGRVLCHQATIIMEINWQLFFMSVKSMQLYLVTLIQIKCYKEMQKWRTIFWRWL